MLWAALPVLGLSLLGAGVASAQGLGGGFGFGDRFMPSLTPEQIAERHTTLFQEQATLTGLSVDELKNAWAEGKNLPQLLTEKGIDVAQVKAKMQVSVEQKMKEQIQTLVDKGVITQAQADKRLQFMKEHPPQARGKMMKKVMGGVPGATQK